jgi:hypothetical protein
MKDIKRIEVSDLIPAYDERFSHGDSENRPDRLYCYLREDGYLFVQPEFDDDPDWNYSSWPLNELRLSLSQLVKITNQFKNLLAFL